MSGKNIKLYKRVFEAERKGYTIIDCSFKRINIKGFDITTKEQTKTLMTAHITRDGSWTTIYIHSHSGIIGYRVFKEEVVFFTLDSHGSDVGVPILVPVDPFERVVTR